MNVQDLRVKRTHKLFHESLIQLMKKKDFIEISISELTQEAGVSRGTFYRYYDNTRELADELIEEVFCNYVESANKIIYPNHSLFTGCTLRCQLLCKHITEYQEFYSVMLSSHGVPGFVGKWQENRKELFFRRYAFDVTNMNPKLHQRLNMLANYVVYAQTGVISYWLTELKEMDPSFIADIIAEYTFTLISAEKNPKIVTKW